MVSRLAAIDLFLLKWVMQKLTRELFRDLNEEGSIAASLATQPAEVGDKSQLEIEIICQTLIKAVGAGEAIVALKMCSKHIYNGRRFCKSKFTRRATMNLRSRPITCVITV